jgi:hypothetical protein
MMQLQMQVEHKYTRADRHMQAPGSDTKVTYTRDERLSTEQHFKESHTVVALYLYQELRGKGTKCSN